MSSLNLEENIKILIIKALNKHHNQAKAASDLGMTPRNLIALIQKYKIKKVYTIID